MPPTYLRPVVLLALAAVLSGAAPPPPRVALRFEAGYPASLYWYLNAVAGDNHVNVAAYREHWRAVAKGGDAEAAAIRTFGEVRDRYRGALPDDEGRENPWIPTPPAPGSDVATRFAACWLGSRTMDEAWLKAAGLLAPTDLKRLKAAFAAVEPKFARQWRGWTYLEAYRRDYVAYAGQVGLAGLLGDTARYLGVPAGTVVDAPVTFVYTPPTRNTHGRKVGGNLIVEVVPGEKPVERVDVVAHEITHLLFEEAGLNDDPRAIAAWFAAAEPGVAAPALSLLNEGVATAVGQGVAAFKYDPPGFDRTLRKPGGWYADDRIDPYAKAIYPLVAIGLAGGPPLLAQAKLYTQAYETTFGPAAAPSAWLGSYFLVLDGRRDAAFKPYFEAAPPRSIYGEPLDGGATAWRRWKGLAAVIGVTRAEFPRLRAVAADWGLDAAALDRLLTGAPGLHVQARPGGAPLYVIAAEDRTQLGLAMGRFARLKAAPAGYTALPEAPQ